MAIIINNNFPIKLTSVIKLLISILLHHIPHTTAINTWRSKSISYLYNQKTRNKLFYKNRHKKYDLSDYDPMVVLIIVTIFLVVGYLVYLWWYSNNGARYVRNRNHHNHHHVHRHKYGRMK